MRTFLTLFAALLMVTFSANADLFDLPAADNLLMNGGFESIPADGTYQTGRDKNLELSQLGGAPNQFTDTYLEAQNGVQGFIPHWETPILGSDTDFGLAGAANRGLGVEMQHAGATLGGQGGGNPAYNFTGFASEGNRWAELDTDASLPYAPESIAGRPTNSWISQSVYLTPGFYEAGFMYMPRDVLPPASYTTNAVGLYISGPGFGGNGGFQELTVADGYRAINPDGSNAQDWVKVIADTFSIAQAGDYLFTLAALGAADGLGGLIDDVRLFKTGEIPEPGTYALVGIGLIGLYFIRRRRQA